MNRRKFVVDLVERTVFTWAEAFLGLCIVSWGATTVGGKVQYVTVLSIVAKAAIAAVPAGLAVAKGLIATLVGNPDSASLAPSVPPPAD